MDLQLTIAVVLVAGSALYLVRVLCRSWMAGKSGCGGGCSCKKTQIPRTEALIPSQEIVLRKRIGEPGG